MQSQTARVNYYQPTDTRGGSVSRWTQVGTLKILKHAGRQAGIEMGAKKETFFGLSGLGDLVLTATNLKSRNTRLGNQIGITDGLKNTSNDLTEGFYTTNAVYNISKKKKIKKEEPPV